ncbi:tetratricopeptide repeat protein [bacterium]|nr:tetratricopeptide repeat protein [bacterium]
MIWLLKYICKNTVYLFLIIAISFLAYILVGEIPFLYYEPASIEQNPKLIHPSLFWQSYFNFKSLFYKPLSLLTYHFNHMLCGPSSFCFHWSNFFIHACNVVLLFLLAQQLRIKHFIWSALFFALHPLSTACVSQIHGRPYALGSLFMLLALNLYFFNAYQSRTKTHPIRPTLVYWSILVLFVCMFLSKQSFIVFPVLIMFHLYNSSSNKKLYLFVPLIVFCTCFLVGIFYLDIIPNISKAVVGPKVYALSQLGNVNTLIKFYILPFQTALVHDLYFYASAFYPQVMLGIFLLILWLFLIIQKRSSLLGWLLFCFILMILPTNSIIPKNEVIREWRLYPSLIFLSLLWGYGLDFMYSKISRFSQPKNLKHILLYTVLIVYATAQFLSIYQQNKIYRNPIFTWQQVTKKYPYSSDAYNNIGVWHARQSDYKQALAYFKKAIELDPKNFAYELNMAACFREMQHPALNRKHTQRAKKKASAYNNRSHSFHLKP